MLSLLISYNIIIYILLRSAHLYTNANVFEILMNTVFEIIVLNTAVKYRLLLKVAILLLVGSSKSLKRMVTCANALMEDTSQKPGVSDIIDYLEAYFNKVDKNEGHFGTIIAGYDATNEVMKFTDN